MVECAFDILCNKWRIFHRAIDVCPAFCDVIVKTCCILHNFVRKKNSFLLQDNLCECPVQNIKTVGTKETDIIRWAQGTGNSLRRDPVGKPGSGLVYWWLMCKRRLRKRAPLSIGCPLGCVGHVLSSGSLRDSWRRALENEHLSLWALCDRKLEGVRWLVYWGPWRLCRWRFWWQASFHRGSAGEPGRGLVYRRRWKLTEGGR
jgi:hypothetical protein